jgi:hypothetical protein
MECGGLLCASDPTRSDIFGHRRNGIFAIVGRPPNDNFVGGGWEWTGWVVDFIFGEWDRAKESTGFASMLETTSGVTVAGRGSFSSSFGGTIKEFMDVIRCADETDHAPRHEMGGQLHLY